MLKKWIPATIRLHGVNSFALGCFRCPQATPARYVNIHREKIILVFFRYERLLDFCYICALLDHQDSNCTHSSLQHHILVLGCKNMALVFGQMAQSLNLSNLWASPHEANEGGCRNLERNEVCLRQRLAISQAT